VTLVVLALLTGLDGCGVARCCVAFQVGDGESSSDFFVLGLGFVSVAKPAGEDAIVASKVRALGVTASDQPGLKLGLGYVSSNTVLVPDGAEDVRVEITDGLGGPLVVDTASAKLKEKEVRDDAPSSK